MNDDGAATAVGMEGRTGPGQQIIDEKSKIQFKQVLAWKCRTPRATSVDDIVTLLINNPNLKMILRYGV